MSFQDAIKEAFALAPAQKTILETLEIRQEGVQDPVFIVQSRRAIVAADENGEWHTFEPVPFQFVLPPASEEGFRSLNLAIDNVGRRIHDFVEAAKAEPVPVMVLYRPYLSDDLTQPQMSPPLTLILKDLQLSDFQVVGRATFMDLVNKKFPAEIYTRERFPALG